MPNFKRRCLFEQAKFRVRGANHVRTSREICRPIDLRGPTLRVLVFVVQQLAERGGTASVILRKMQSGGALFEPRIVDKQLSTDRAG